MMQDSGFITPIGDITAVSNPANNQADKSDLKVKVFKLHMELCKAKEMLE